MELVFVVLSSDCWRVMIQRKVQQVLPQPMRRSGEKGGCKRERGAARDDMREVVVCLCVCVCGARYNVRCLADIGSVVSPPCVMGASTAEHARP